MGKAKTAPRQRKPPQHQDVRRAHGGTESEQPSPQRSVAFVVVTVTLICACLIVGSAVGGTQWVSRLTSTTPLSSSAPAPAAIQPSSRLPVIPPVSGTRFAERGDNRCGIQLAARFLSTDETLYLLDLVQRTGGWQDSPTAGPQFQVPTGSTTGAFAREVNRDPVVHRIEERIADATGIPVHPDEDLLSFARIRSRDNNIRHGNYPPFGLHHESDTRPNRARTVLIYLEAPHHGGRTIFPLCGLPSSDAVTIERRRLFESELGQQWGEKSTGYGRHVGIDPKMDHPFNEFLTDVCDDQDGYAVSPVAGSAIMFDSVRPGTNVPYNLTWHAGCNVIAGTKIILQKFKELPFAERLPSVAKFRQKEYFPYRSVRGIR